MATKLPTELAAAVRGESGRVCLHTCHIISDEMQTGENVRKQRLLLPCVIVDAVQTHVEKGLKEAARRSMPVLWFGRCPFGSLQWSAIVPV